MKRELVVSALLAALATVGTSVAAGLEYTWIGGASTDWTAAANYAAPDGSSAALPGAGDSVAIPAETTAKLLASDAASVALVSALERVHLTSATSFLEVNVAADDPETTLGCGVNAWTGYVSNSRGYGGLVKTGAGVLWLNRASRDLYTKIDVREGDVRLVGKAATYFLENVTVAAGTRFFANPGGYTSAGWLSGLGLVTNTVTQVFQLEEKTAENVFEGEIGGHVYFYAGGKLTLNGVANTMNNFTVRDNAGLGAAGPVAEIKSFGKAGQPSSIGGYNNIFLAGGAYLRYGGTGETTDKTLYVNDTSDYPYFLDGGAFGGLTFAGGISFPTAGDSVFCLTGTNRTPCVFAGSILCQEGGGSVRAKIVKSGSGTWRLADHAYRLNTDVVDVQEGTLQFDSLAENGTRCALGLGPGESALYSLLLGGADGSCGMLEYTGAQAAKVTTRMVGLNSVGGFRSDSAPLRISGVMDAMDVNEDPKTLVLDGAAGSANDLQNVRESGCPISIRKEGAGTWSVGGACEISGKVEVKAGTLVARDPTLYRWYRFNIKKLYNKNSSGDSSADGNFMIWVFGLYDAEGNWITAGYPQHGDDCALGAGAAGFASGTFEGKWEYSTDTYGNLANAFVDDVSNASRCCGRFRNADGQVMEPDPNDESTWGRIVIRVADDAPEVTSFDFVQSGYYSWASPYNVVTWSLDASVDGINWEEISATENARGLWASSGNGTYSQFWYYGREQYAKGQAAAHATGKAIPPRSASVELPTPLASVASVEVAPGATFRSAGANRPVGALTVDVNGMGRLDGFAFGEEGTLEVVNAGRLTAPVALPGTYANVTGIANLAGWNLTVDGVAKEAVRIAVDTSGADPVIRLLPPPMALILR